MLKRRQKGNKGFSLVELVCAVAIVGISSVAIGGAMVVSSQSYQRGTIELEVQKEAQATTNLIGNLLVDAVDVDFNDTTDWLTITGKDTKYEVAFKAGTQELTYKEIAGAVISDEVTLAEGVTAFDVDDNDFATTKNVEIDLTVASGGKEYTASYNTTARNGKMQPGVQSEASIIVDSSIVMEPGQTYSLPIKLIGMTLAEVGGLTREFVTNASMVDSMSIAADGKSATIMLNSSAQGIIAFNIKTVNNVVDSDNDGVVDSPASKLVTIRVRSVTGIENMSANLISGVAFAQDAVYRVYATAAGNNLDKEIGKAYDADYVNPKYIDFKVTSVEGFSSSVVNNVLTVTSGYDKENSNAPYLEFKLKEAMPAGAKIHFGMTAKHSVGQIAGEKDASNVPLLYNKVSTASAAYSYGAVTNTYTLENPNSPIGDFEDGILRGDDAYFTSYIGELGDIRMAHTSNANGKAGWFMRYREAYSNGTYGTWSRYFRMVQGGNRTKINASETYVFRPEYAYQIQVACVVWDDSNKQILWPCDTGLLSAGFGDSGFTQGWDPSEPVTPTTEYSVICEVDGVSVAFYANTFFGNPDGTVCIGGASYEAAKNMVTGDSVELTYDTVAMKTGHFNNDLKVDLAMWDGSEWDDDASPSGWALQQDAKISISNIQSSATGLYRFGIYIDNYKLKTLNNTDVLNPTFTETEIDSKLYDASNGVAYIKFNY